MPDTFNAPLQLLYPAAAAMALDSEESSQCSINGVEPGHALRCETPLNIGVFFDGTNNNAERDEPERAHSNVVRLFNAHPAADHKGKLYRPGHYRIYVPGVGTPFAANGELRESVEGKAMGKGGQARILFAVLQVFNSIYKAFQAGNSLFDDSTIAAKLKEFTAQTDPGSRDSEAPRHSRDQWLRQLNQDIGAAIDKARERAPLPRIPDIYVSAFGFSRGAAQAVAFCHWLDKALPQGRIAGMPVRIGFLGLFDCRRQRRERCVAGPQWHAQLFRERCADEGDVPGGASGQAQPPMGSALPAAAVGGAFIGTGAVRMTPQGAPSGGDLPALVELVRSFVGFEYVWEIELSIRSAATPPSRLGDMTRLGWSTWMTGERASQEPVTGMVFEPEGYRA